MRVPECSDHSHCVLAHQLLYTEYTYHTSCLHPAGTEAHYLRALITRIACSTVCCPINSFIATEDGAIEKNEEYEGFKDREAGLPSHWSHRCGLSGAKSVIGWRVWALMLMLRASRMKGGAHQPSSVQV